MQSLCQDVVPNVRTGMCQHLSTICAALNRDDCSNLILPTLIELCSDEDSSVRETVYSMGCSALKI